MAINTSFSDYRKKELTFNLNPFDQPSELTGTEAWARLILTIAFMEEGTMPSLPMIGCGFGNISYENETSLRDARLTKLEQQVKTYYPDIPLDSITFETKEYNGSKVGIFIINFITEMQTIETVAAATSKTSTGLLNIQLSF